MRKASILAFMSVLAMTVSAGAASGAVTEIEASESSTTVTSVGRALLLTPAVAPECNISLTVALNETIENEPGAEVGTVSEGSVSNCSAGSASVLFTGGNWPVTLRQEVLYSMQAVVLDVSNVQFSFLIGISCLYGGAMGLVLTGEVIERNASTESAGYVYGSALTKSSGSIFCPSSGLLLGAFTLSPEVTLTLSP